MATIVKKTVIWIVIGITIVISGGAFFFCLIQVLTLEKVSMKESKKENTISPTQPNQLIQTLE